MTNFAAPTYISDATYLQSPFIKKEYEDKILDLLKQKLAAKIEWQRSYWIDHSKKFRKERERLHPYTNILMYCEGYTRNQLAIKALKKLIAFYKDLILDEIKGQYFNRLQMFFEILLIIEKTCLFILDKEIPFTDDFLKNQKELAPIEFFEKKIFEAGFREDANKDKAADLKCRFLAAETLEIIETIKLIKKDIKACI